MVIKTSANLMHSDNDLSMLLEPAVAEVHIDGPEAGPSNDELHENSHSENGEEGAPVFDGHLKHPERQNTNAIREALETQVEMEVGKTISKKEQEVAAQEKVQDVALAQGAGSLAGGVPAAEVTAKPGTQIVINVAAKRKRSGTVQSEPIGGENQSGATNDSAGGLFGGTDLEGPSFKDKFAVNFTFRGTPREASFSSVKEAHMFIKSASEKFGKIAANFTMKCPNCKGQASKDKHEDSYKCKSCGWDSNTAPKQASAKKAEIDPAKRNLILELLKGGRRLTTGEIEKALGGGKYTNIAWPVLQELAKEGILAHKQMRWSLKTASRKIAFGKRALSIETRLNEKDNRDVFREVLDKLNVIHADLRKKNPQGFMDSFEQQLPSRMMDIAEQMGLQMDYTPESDTYLFYDQTAAGTKGKSHEELVGKSQKTPPVPAKQKGIGPESGMSMASLKSASIRITSAKAMPRKGTPEWHELQIAIQTMKMPDPMINIMGGPDRAASEQTLARYGLRWDEEAYMAGGKGVKKAGDGMAKTVEVEAAVEKEAGFNFFFPGQVLEEFYPELQHEIVDYPNATNQPMSGAGNPEIVGDGGHELEGILDEALDTNVVEMIQLPADVGEVEPLAMAAADYSSTSPAGGLGIGRDGKPEVLEGAPLRKEMDIRGYMFTDEFYGQYDGIPGAAMNVASKIAAEGDEAKQFGMFLKKVCGEIAATLVGAFKITQRPLLDKVPGMGEIQLDTIEQGSNAMALGQITQGGRVKYILSKINDGEIKSAINSAWAQAAVWNDNPEGGFIYEVFIRPETIDTDSLVMKYRFVCGTRE